MMERRLQIFTISKAIRAEFNSSDWTEIGYLTGMDTYITGHRRLLRSLDWGDDDYKGHVFETVDRILDAAPNNLKVLVEYEPIASWLGRNDPAALQSLRAEVGGLSVPEVIPTGSEAAMQALADAQALLESRGPTSAVDRVHTGLHGFLKGACSEAGIAALPDATPNQLLKSLLESHPLLQDLGPRCQEVRKIIRTSASIVDSMGTLRNHASLAHPNEDLLDHDEALLVINLWRSLLGFLSAKLRVH